MLRRCCGVALVAAARFSTQRCGPFFIIVHAFFLKARKTTGVPQKFHTLVKPLSILSFKQNLSSTSIRAPFSTDRPSVVFVANLPSDSTSQTIASLFGDIGGISKRESGGDDIHLFMDKETGEFKGSCKITFENPGLAEEAVSRFDRHQIGSNSLLVKLWVPKERTFEDRRGGDRSGGRPARGGDWSCPKCHAHVFASKTACFRCETPKPENATLVESSGNRGHFGDRNGRSQSRGGGYSSRGGGGGDRDRDGGRRFGGGDRGGGRGRGGRSREDFD